MSKKHGISARVFTRRRNVFTNNKKKVELGQAVAEQLRPIATPGRGWTASQARQPSLQRWSLHWGALGRAAGEVAFFWPPTTIWASSQPKLAASFAAERAARDLDKDATHVAMDRGGGNHGQQGWATVDRGAGGSWGLAQRRGHNTSTTETALAADRTSRGMKHGRGTK